MKGSLAYVGDQQVTFSFGGHAFRAKLLEACDEEESLIIEAVAKWWGYSEVLHEVTLTGRLPSDSTSLGMWLRKRYRLLGLGALERATTHAHERGRQQAFRELAREA